MTRPALFLALIAAPAFAHHDHFVDANKMVPPMPTPRPITPADWAGPADMPCGDPWLETPCEGGR